jgi:hypothetical protein
VRGTSSQPPKVHAVPGSFAASSICRAPRTPRRTTDIVSNGPICSHCKHIGGTNTSNCPGPPSERRLLCAWQQADPPTPSLCDANGSSPCCYGRSSDCDIWPTKRNPWADVNAALECPFQSQVDTSGLCRIDRQALERVVVSHHCPGSPLFKRYQAWC